MVRESILGKTDVNMKATTSTIGNTASVFIPGLMVVNTKAAGTTENNMAKASTDS